MQKVKNWLHNFKILLIKYQTESNRSIIKLLYELSVKSSVKTYFFSFGGTGSSPQPPQGWQRLMRRIPSHNPLNGP